MMTKTTLCFLTAKDCGPLTAPLNGSIAGRETFFPSKVKLSCDEGFLLNGSSVRRCQASGNWSGIEASCKGKIEEKYRELFSKCHCLHKELFLT